MLHIRFPGLDNIVRLGMLLSLLLTYKLMNCLLLLLMLFLMGMHFWNRYLGSNNQVHTLHILPQLYTVLLGML